MGFDINNLSGVLGVVGASFGVATADYNTPAQTLKADYTSLDKQLAKVETPPLGANGAPIRPAEPGTGMSQARAEHLLAESLPRDPKGLITQQDIDAAKVAGTADKDLPKLGDLKAELPKDYEFKHIDGSRMTDAEKTQFVKYIQSAPESRAGAIDDLTGHQVMYQRLGAVSSAADKILKAVGEGVQSEKRAEKAKKDLEQTHERNVNSLVK